MATTEKKYYSTTNTQRQLIQDALEAVNSGDAKLEWQIVGSGPDDIGSWQQVLVSKDGTIFPNVSAKDIGNGQVILQTAAPAEYGTNQNFTINTTLNPSTGTLSPLQTQDQVSIVSSPSSGGFGFLDNTLGAVNDWISGDPLKAAALFTAAAYGLPALGEATTAGAATAGANVGTATLGDLAMAYDPVAANIAAGMTPEVASAVAAEQLLTNQLAQPITADVVTSTIAGNADKAAGVGAGSSVASGGATLKNALDVARAGLLVNALTGDPLGLSDIGGGGSSAPPGFAQVPIPEDWTSPTYTYSPVQNVTFEDLFPGVSLQGTQWQNLPRSQTFNEMFAAGQQQTPMGSPVDINQIVGSILGQTTTS